MANRGTLQQVCNNNKENNVNDNTNTVRGEVDLEGRRATSAEMCRGDEIGARVVTHSRA